MSDYMFVVVNTKSFNTVKGSDTMGGAARKLVNAFCGEKTDSEQKDEATTEVHKILCERNFSTEQEKNDCKGNRKTVAEVAWEVYSDGIWWGDRFEMPHPASFQANFCPSKNVEAAKACTPQPKVKDVYAYEQDDNFKNNRITWFKMEFDNLKIKRDINNLPKITLENRGFTAKDLRLGSVDGYCFVPVEAEASTTASCRNLRFKIDFGGGNIEYRNVGFSYVPPSTEPDTVAPVAKKALKGNSAKENCEKNPQKKTIGKIEITQRWLFGKMCGWPREGTGCPRDRWSFKNGTCAPVAEVKEPASSAPSGNKECNALQIPSADMHAAGNGIDKTGKKCVVISGQPQWK